MATYKKSLAKVFGPAVLLTAALALPIESVAVAAPAPGFAVVKVDKDNRGKQNKQKHQNRVNRGQARKQQVQAQRERSRQQQVRVQRQQVRQQRVVAQQRAQIRQQQRVAAQRQAQIRQQRIENQRLATIRQQQIAAQRQAQIRRQRDLQIARERAAVRRYNNDRYVYDNRYNNQYRGRGGADRSVIAADGILEDTGRCFILRGHQGQVYNLVGGTDGLREGEHVRLVGRLLYDRDGCGEAMDVHQVQAIWADRNHRQTYFDHQRDGSFRNSYRERYGDRYYDEYEDDYRYDDYYYDPPR